MKSLFKKEKESSSVVININVTIDSKEYLYNTVFESDTELSDQVKFLVNYMEETFRGRMRIIAEDEHRKQNVKFGSWI